MSGRVAIFFDGAYLDKVLLHEFGGARIDYHALSQKLKGNSFILRTYYYHCPIFQGDPPTQKERERYSIQRKFFDSINKLPRFAVRLGKLARRGSNPDGTPHYEQKRVDIQLSVDMVQLATKHRIEDAVLLAGDSDFIPAVVAAKSEGVLVRVFHGDRIHYDLSQEADERNRITPDLVNSVLRNPRTS